MADGKVLGALRVQRVGDTPNAVRSGAPVRQQAPIPTDNEATIERARFDARDMLRSGETEVYVIRSRIKLPSGVTGYRYFALGETLFRLFDLQTGPTNEIVERIK